MFHTEPKTFLIAKTMIVDSGMREWLDFIGAEKYEYKKTESDAQNLIMAIAKRCYKSFEPGLNPNIKKVREDAFEYIDNILKVKHGSVLEHATFSFAIEDVSRVFSGEMNRHRAGMAISEGSMRYIRFNDIPFWMPTSFKHDESDPSSVRDLKMESRKLLDASFKHTEEVYTQLTELWGMDDIPDFATKKYLTSAFRRPVGLGVSAGGVWSGNIRALRHIFEMRCSKHAEEEILFVANMLLEKMLKECLLLFGDFYKDPEGYWTPKYSKV